MMVFNCKACGKPIVFITTVAGKKMPCDAMVRAYEPDADGPDTIITKDGQTVRGRVLAPAADGGKLGRIPHWASCPGAAGLRKARNPK
jgi:hypothetical protein